MGTKANNLILIEEFVPINGISQYLFHSGTNYDNPVMLFLHGEPEVLNLYLHMPFKKSRKTFLP